MTEPIAELEKRCLARERAAERRAARRLAQKVIPFED